MKNHLDGAVVSLGYDALGRRIWKNYRQTTTHWHWDGNVPLHEWKGFISKDALSENLITWVFEEDSFSPIAKVKGNKYYSILADHLGTPIEMYQDDGSLFWERSLNANGKVLKVTQAGSCPFLFQGQYYDAEIELAYNRFRYYDPEDGKYISQDPIGLLSGEFGFYNYVEDPLTWLDIFGLGKSHYSGERGRKKAMHDLKKNGFEIISEEVTMKVNGKRIRADFVAKKDGKVYVIEVKNGSGQLTKNQSAANVFNKNAANTNNGLGHSNIKTGQGTNSSFDLSTQNQNIANSLTDAGISTTNQPATFYLFKY